METCPFGDQDVDCFDNNNLNCQDEQTRERCCDACASVTTPPPPSTTTATTPITTSACVDNDPSLCLAAVNNSRAFCYTGSDECCATCAARRIKYLPEYCAWGDQKKDCATYDKGLCETPSINETCCKSCGNFSVGPTIPPCTTDDDPNYDCSATARTPSLCYNSLYYSHCCQSCSNVRMEYLPTGCKWGDKAEFCDSSSKICNEYGNEECCASCCTDCVAPTTTTTTMKPTTPTTLPPGCLGDHENTDCASLVTNPSSCYNGDVARLCCQSCYDVRRKDLPNHCPYGDKLSTCSALTWEECSNPNNEDHILCCERCYNLLNVSCDVSMESTISNCNQTVSRAGTCYTEETLNKCCKSCKDIAIYSLPDDCRFGDKVSWCSDINAGNIDRICSLRPNQESCCSTCRDYVGRTTTVPTTSTASTPPPTTTRLPPNEQCPSGDTAPKCEGVWVNATGDCYNPQTASICCRTCYELWQDDLPNNCRYGDKAPFCLSISESVIDYDWCLNNGETCCARCASYLTTTVPTTTLPQECPNGNNFSDCDTRVPNAFDCYSPVREDGCCVQCQGFIKSYLPYTCRYGDKADYCKEIAKSECDAERATCCETCGTFTSTTSKTSTTTVPTTVIPTTVQPPTVKIGRTLFARPAPPGDTALFNVTFTRKVTCDAEWSNTDSRDFLIEQNTICADLDRRIPALSHCLVHSIKCTQGAPDVLFTVFILINSDENKEATANKLKARLGSSSARRKREISYNAVLVEDVNECTVTNALLKNSCDNDAICTNTEGSYTCQCPTNMDGNGFSCEFKDDPIIGINTFIRGVPPGEQYLYMVRLNVLSSSGSDYTCFVEMEEPMSIGFKAREMNICKHLATAMTSVEYCYVEKFACTNKEFELSAYVIIDGSQNYENSNVTANILRNQISSKFPGEVLSQLIEDVDECTTKEAKLQDGCHMYATCKNSPGLYSCTCKSGFTGDGYIDCGSPPTTPAGAPSGIVSRTLEDWTIAVIVVGGVIVLVAIALLCVCCLRARRNKGDQPHEQLTGGEETPPTVFTGNMPPLYNSLRSAKAPASEYGGSFFYAPQESELPGFAMKTYNVGAYGNDADDTATFRFE